MKENKVEWVVILIVVVLIAVVADIAVHLSGPEKSKQPSRCLEVPIKFAMEYPDCTNKLLKAANLTNIRIVLSGTLEEQRYNQSKFYKISHQRLLTNQTE